MEPYILMALFLAYAFLTDSRGRQERQETANNHAEEVTAQRSEIALLHVAHAENMAKLFTEHRAEVAALCQRIQAPELAVVEHQQAQAQEASAHPPTDEQLAEEQAKAAFLQRVEQVENENAGPLA